MKKLVFFLLAALPVLAGCDPAALTRSAAPGTEIRFSANTSYDNMPGTKTVYSGQTYDVALSGSSAKYERIDWVGGDKIRICSPQASHCYESRGWADYDIVAGSIVANGRNSSARITNEPGANGLVWGDAASYTFFALYPSPRTAGVDAAKVSITDNVITATLPAVQTVSAPAGSRVYAPDMRYAYMWAATAAAPGPVDLYFKPLVTAFEFTLDSRDDASIELSGFSLVAETGSPALAGDFTATVGAGLTECPVTAVANPALAVDVNFGGNITVVQGQPVTFTVFALPHDLTGLSIRIHKADGTTQELALKQGGQYVHFPGGKKIRITNVAVPAGETWTYSIDEIADLVSYGHRASALDFTVKSHRTSSLGADEAVPWTVQYSADGTNWVDAASWTDNRFALSATAGPGSAAAGEANQARILRDHTASERQTSGSFDTEDAAIAVLRNRGSLPSAASDAGDGYFDLSKHGFYVSNDGSEDYVDQPEEAMETANCYVITRPGKYKFPLVYGNAIRGGTVNSRAYAPQGTSGHNNQSVNYYLYRFLNHAGTEIVDPWIKNNGVTVHDAVVVWQDVSGRETQILHDGDISISSDYIRFEIKEEYIRPGNILLAARNASGTIVWSWHLWVTEKTLSTHPVKDKMNVSHDMLGYNLGWTDKRNAYGEKWNDWTFYVRISQSDAAGTARVFRVRQIGESISVDANVGSNTFYQWGRKDPILPAASSDRNKSYYSNAGYTVTENDYKVVTEATSAGIGYSIMNPYKILYNRPNYQYYGSMLYGNLWDVDMIANNTATGGNSLSNVNRLPVKSIYDPSPRGFVVPYTFAFTGFSSRGATENNDGTPVGSPATDGYNFSDGNGGYIYFPYSGARGGDGTNPIYDVTSTMYYWTTGKLPSDDRWNNETKSKNLSFWKPTRIRAINDQFSEGAYAVRPVRQVAF